MYRKKTLSQSDTRTYPFGVPDQDAEEEELDYDETESYKEIIVKNTESKQRRKFFKKEAKHLLFQGNHWLQMVFCTFFYMMVTVSLKYMAQSFFAVFDTSWFQEVSPIQQQVMKYAASYCSDILYVIFMVPLGFGLLLYMMQLSSPEENPSPVLIFTYFQSIFMIARVYKIFFAYFWRIFLYVAFLIIGCILLPDFYTILNVLFYPLLANSVIVAIGVFLFLFSIFGAIFLHRYYLVFYIAVKHPELSIHSVVKCSVFAMKGYKHEIVLFFGSFILWFLLSFLTVGILFVVFTIPYFIFANLSYAGYLYDRSAFYIEKQMYQKPKRKKKAQASIEEAFLAQTDSIHWEEQMNGK